jgi:hypothetical protein
MVLLVGAGSAGFSIIAPVHRFVKGHAGSDGRRRYDEFAGLGSSTERSSMSTYVIVANQTLPSPTLWRAVTDRAKPGAAFHAVVPLTPVGHGFTWDEDESRKQAEERLGAFLERVRALDVAATGEVGDRDPVQAVSDCLRKMPNVDEIILSTLPPGISRWLGQDVAGRLRSSVPIPVAVVYEDAQAPVPPR